ncbi:MAG TPA: BolA family protein [Stellaceae bacterium]|nr:BolA family protein [Stellaceae bacterium]
MSYLPAIRIFAAFAPRNHAAIVSLDTAIAAPKLNRMRVADRIRAKLTAALQPTRLVIRDDSQRHAGHAGARPEGETHFHVEIVSAAFAGDSRVVRQRRVYALLAEEMAGPIHALALATLTPEEAAGG